MTAIPTSPTDPRQARILIIGTGVAGLRIAKTLLDDGFAQVHLVSESLSAGGVWALDDSGKSYPGLATNSGLGDYEFSEVPVKESEEYLKKNEDRISGATLGRYLEDYYARFIKDRASTRFAHKVLSMNRAAGSTTGWKVVIQQIGSEKTTEEFWDKVVLCTGWTSTPAMPPCLADPFADKTFNGILAHSSQITAGMHDKILTLPPDSTKIVVVGIGKSAIDLAGIYASLGRDVTVVFRNAKIFANGDPSTDALIQTRIGSTIATPRHVKTRLEWFVHCTRLGGWLIRKMTNNMIATWSKALKVQPGSDLEFHGERFILWLGTKNVGGRALSTPSSFHMLAAEGKLKTVKGVSPTGISADGNGLVLSDGQTLPADVIICATGFGAAWSFIPRDTRLQLGLEPIAPVASTNKFEGFPNHPILHPVPAPPRSDPATHIFRGIVPYGAMESKDLAICGGAFALKFPFISEITSHWISSHFLGSKHFSHPAKTNQQAFDEAEDHAEWIRARYPVTPFPWASLGHVAFLNTDQYIETLFDDMGVNSSRRAGGWSGMGFYTGKLTPADIKDLGEERRALRVASGEEGEEKKVKR